MPELEITTPELRTREGVHLARVGVYKLSTGTQRFTRDHLRAAVEAQQTQAIAPRIKVGHVDPRFDGEPALGVVRNLRLADDGDALVGDLVGIPAWLDDALPSAYPGRSIEAKITGDQMEITALSLLGITRPGIDTLRDLEHAVAAAAVECPADPAVVQVAVALTQLRAAAEDEGPEAGERPAHTTQEESAMDPKSLRETLGLAEDASDEDVTARLQELKDRPTAEQVTEKVTEQVTEQVEERVEEAVAAAVKAEQEKVAASSEGVVRLDQATYEGLKASAEKGAEAHERQQREDRERFVAAAISVGKFPPSRRDHYLGLMERDPEGTREFIESLDQGAVPIAARGHNDDTAATGGATATGWFPQLQES